MLLDFSDDRNRLMLRKMKFDRVRTYGYFFNKGIKPIRWVIIVGGVLPDLHRETLI